jgi:hypothetical protein
VDDIIFGSTNNAFCREFLRWCRLNLKCHLWVSLHISWDYKSSKPTFIDQTRYFLELLKKINMKDTKPISTPMASSLSNDKDGCGIKIEVTKYRGMLCVFQCKST